MAAIGTGNVAPGRMTVSLGTSGTLFAYSDTPIIDESGCIAAFLLFHGWVVAAVVHNELHQCDGAESADAGLIWKTPKPPSQPLRPDRMAS